MTNIEVTTENVTSFLKADEYQDVTLRDGMQGLMLGIGCTHTIAIYRAARSNATHRYSRRGPLGWIGKAWAADCRRDATRLMVVSL